MAFVECIRDDASYWLKDYLPSDRLTAGEYTYFDTRITFGLWQPEDRVIIGKFCSLAKDITIFGGGEHFTDRATTYPFVLMFAEERTERLVDAKKTNHTNIGHDVWLGYGATVMSGVKIGNGAIVGAKTVVAKDIPDYAVAIGNPARIVRYRFQPQTIARLLDLGWWDWELNKILANLDLLYQNPDTWASDLQFRQAPANSSALLTLQQLKNWKII